MSNKTVAILAAVAVALLAAIFGYGMQGTPPAVPPPSEGTDRSEARSPAGKAGQIPNANPETSGASGHGDMGDGPGAVRSPGRGGSPAPQ